MNLKVIKSVTHLAFPLLAFPPLSLGADLPSSSSPSPEGASFFTGGSAVAEVEDWARFLELLRVLGGDLGVEEAVAGITEDLGGIIKQYLGSDISRWVWMARSDSEVPLISCPSTFSHALKNNLSSQ
jgi:hypothetical protein